MKPTAGGDLVLKKNQRLIRNTDYRRRPVVRPITVQHCHLLSYFYTAILFLSQSQNEFSNTCTY